MVLFNQALHDVESQARAFARAFGGKERLKNFRQRLGGNARTCVADGQGQNGGAVFEALDEDQAP